MKRSLNLLRLVQLARERCPDDAAVYDAAMQAASRVFGAAVATAMDQRDAAARNAGNAGNAGYLDRVESEYDSQCRCAGRARLAAEAAAWRQLASAVRAAQGGEP
jgi:hypothetical protein